MGGNFYGLGRVTRSEYLQIENELREFLDERFGPELYKIPRYYGSKPDFGDVDVLLSRKVLEEEGSGDWESIKTEIAETLGITQHKKNGNMWSTVYRNFQVDFIPVSHKNLDAEANFMAFNDLGNIIGRIFLPFNLKYSDHGLFYVFRRDDVDGQPSSYKREILVSQDWNKILTFIGLDYEPWENGFDTLDEMFDWVLTSPYFRSSPYLDPKSRIMKKRIRLRTTMKKFIEYLEKNNVGDRKPPQFRQGRDAYVEEIEQYFGGGLDLQGEIQKEIQKEKDAKLLSAKLNGRLVMEWIPTLQGKSLGHFLRTLHKEITKEELLQMSPSDIEEVVRKRYSDMFNESAGSA